MIYPSSFEQKIGFDRLREQVAALTTMPSARRRVEGERFSTSPREIERRLLLADEMRQLLMMEYDFPGGEYADPEGVVQKLAVEGTFLDVEEVMLLHAALRTVGEVVRFVVGEEEPKSLPAERCIERSRGLVHLLSRLYGALYGINPAPLMRLVRRARRSHGVMRAVWLKRLSDLPPSQDALLACGDFDEDRSREVRFAVLLIRLCAEPQTALFRIAHFDSPLRTCEVGEILHHLRRGLLPIAYHPLLESENGNLRRLGLAIVRQFSIEEADARLWCMVAEEGDRELAAASLYTLLTLHRPLRRRQLLGYLARLNEEERRAVMRRLAHIALQIFTVKLFHNVRAIKCHVSKEKRGVIVIIETADNTRRIHSDVNSCLLIEAFGRVQYLHFKIAELELHSRMSKYNLSTGTAVK